MARTLSFDKMAALEAAMRLFWAKGYEGTSVRDLADELGLQLASIYNAFGDKRRLFEATVSHYLATYLAPKLTALQADPEPLNGLRRFFDGVREACRADQSTVGCFYLSALMDLAHRHPDVADSLKPHLDAVRRAFVATLTAAKAQGFDDPLTPAKRADYLLGAFVGMVGLSRLAAAPGVVATFADTALAFLPPARRAAKSVGSRG